MAAATPPGPPPTTMTSVGITGGQGRPEPATPSRRARRASRPRRSSQRAPADDQPAHRLGQRLGCGPVAHLAPVALGRGQAGLDQRLQVLDDGLTGDGEVDGQVAGRVRPVLDEPLQETPPGRVGQRVEEGVDGVDQTLASAQTESQSDSTPEIPRRRRGGGESAPRRPPSR